MIKKVDPDRGPEGSGGSSGFVDKVKKPKNLAIMGAIIALGFLIAFISAD